MNYFYDGQFRKYIKQFMRLFSGFSVETGKAVDGNSIYRTIPVNYGDITRMAANIIKNNSENVINTTPFISLYITSIRMAPERRTYQQHTSTAYVAEKKYDYEQGAYTSEQGNNYEVTRYNPVPYNLVFNVDIWTSNTDQKLQILEQMYVLFNPHINIRTNDSMVDWSSVTYVELTDITWSGRSIPSGVDDVIDISTLQFTVPIYLNPPAQVRKQNIIHNIITKLNVFDEENLKFFEKNQPFESQFTNHTIITFENYKLQFDGFYATILTKSGALEENGQLLNWETILKMYGDFREGISQIRISRSTNIEDTGDEIIGTFSLDPDEQNKIIIYIDPDTIPSNTLGTIARTIDPTVNYPNDGLLPPPALSQKYLLLADTNISSIWNVDAKENDIIIYNGSNWVVFFDATSQNTERVFDLTADKQYEWDGEMWKLSYEGVYNPGYWRIYL